MGFERKIGIAAALAMLPGAAFAAPAEPLVVTELPDASLVPLSGAPSGQSPEDATARFSLAVAQALASDQRANEQACRSSRPAPGTDPVTRYQWRARCLYQRR
jgi:hypothetical protein